jgi:hypothetical protein
MRKEDSEIPIFWSPEYSSLQGEQNALLKLIAGDVNESFVAPYKIASRRFKSPGVGTFGGFYTSDLNADWNIVFRELIAQFQSIREFEIIFPPAYFEVGIFHPQLAACLKMFNPEVTVDLNQHVEISGDSERLLSKGNRKKLRQFRERNGSVTISDLGGLDSAIQLLEDSRKRMGVHLSMSKEKIVKSFELLPDRYTCFQAFVDGNLQAAAIVVKLSSETNYVLYWGDSNESGRSLSPTVALFDEIYKHSQKNAFKVLDLGISSVNGEVNPGLQRFKANLGALTTSRTRVVFQNPMSLA